LPTHRISNSVDVNDAALLLASLHGRKPTHPTSGGHLRRDPPRRTRSRGPRVADVEGDGQTIRCLVYGSFQPFLEAMRGYEVISLTAIPIPDGTHARPLGDEVADG
jgi:hypothetical protein